jgi:hypothetical protein
VPAISIDTFFACVLLVSTVIASMALYAGTPGINTTHLQGAYDEQYLNAISENILESPGMPKDWGADSTLTPEALGLAPASALVPGEVDIDKVCRLNDQNAFALSYSSILNASRLRNVAFGISTSQLLDISVTLNSNSSLGEVTIYTFKILVSQNHTPVVASIHSYVVARGFFSDQYNTTSTDGLAYLDVEIPDSSNGTAVLVTFARVSYDQRITAYGIYAFGHCSSDPSPNGTFLNLSPLNYTLAVRTNFSDETLDRCYALSYTYQSDLASSSDTTYSIPRILDNSPVALIMSGLNGSTFFIEWTAYPQIPSQDGLVFQDSECHTFSYIILVKGALYQLTLRFGGLDQWSD